MNANLSVSDAPIALITGASRGIGMAIAQRLHEMGMRLSLCARSSDALKAFSSQLAESAESSAKILYTVCDVQDPAQVTTVVEKTLSRFGRIDVLINNAGVAPRIGLLQEISPPDIQRTLDTNLKGAIYFMQAILPGMIAQGHGTIININSIAGKTAYPFWSVYDASKFALRAITEAAAEEQRTNNIRITGVYPGAVSTDIWDGLDLVHPPAPEGMLLAEDIADAVAYILALPQRVYIPEMTITPLKPAL